jgi:CheY-like chemotaxis protein
MFESSSSVIELVNGAFPPAAVAVEFTAAKVLLAEDQEAMRTLLSRALRDVGYDVVEVGDGATLCRELKEGLRDEDNPREFDLVISDIRMPEFSGLEALEFIRGTNWAIPVILMTGFGDQPTHEEAHRLGAARVFDKPLDVDELVKEAVRLVEPR